MTPAELRRISLVRALVVNGKARDQRKLRHLSLKEVADAIGTSQSTVHRWEAGETVPSAANALQWAEALGVVSDDSTLQVAR
ncbi:helix-turn-helix transcriptional regulator [Streptomyces sp. KN37]|uniref:helix-turn-helix domain-containing protein n=1 Tax=Streptomyces sp. KN37 TaxID=3090667 RepID=UPI002A75ACC3|nr:helix-turn-helix transcriptional regulator [Streptomyces sp. KN37]WPO69912.1 helix-turn-helix transcriptional regulator [Streptomyces sp. KN37]